MNVTMKHLVNRINLDTELMKKHPENKELLQRRIANHKELIVQCALKNTDNPLLDNIILE